MQERTEYPLKLTINGRSVSRVIIDQHYRIAHSDIDDALILKLVMELNLGNYPIENEKDGFEYFVVEPVIHDDKPYRLVLLLCVHDDFLGVVNAFRVRRRK